MKTLKKTISMLMAASLVLTTSIFTSCDDDDDYNTSQIKGGVSLTAAQLQVTRGAYMQFKGSGLDKVTSIIFPEDVEATPEVVDKYTIRCIVPEEATVGTVKLLYDGGTKALETDEIAFTEPITIDGFAPASAKAGDVVTVKGRYLEYFTHARFATGEVVELQSVTRNEVKVVVPVDASTGEFVLSYYTEVDGEKIPNENPVAEIAIEEPKATIPADAVKNGDEITISGSLLRLVQTVKFQNAEAINVAVEDPTKDVANIVVTIPETARKGNIELTLLSGVVVSAGSIAFVEPEVDLFPGTVKDGFCEPTGEVYFLGSEVKITGKNLDGIVAVNFGNGSTTEFTLNEDFTELVCTIPGSATYVNQDQSFKLYGDQTNNWGQLYSSWANGYVTGVSTRNGDNIPAGILYAEWGEQLWGGWQDEVGGKFHMNGPNSNLFKFITNVTIAGDKVAFLEEEGSVFMVESIDAKYALNPVMEVTLTNGVKISKEAKLEVPDYNFITEIIPEKINELATIRLNGANFSSETQLFFGDVEIPIAVLDENSIYATLSRDVEEGKYEVTVKDSKGSHTWPDPVSVIGSDPIAIWEGKSTVTWSGGAVTDLSWGGFDWSTVSVGQSIYLYFKIDDENPVIRFGNGSWKALPSTLGFTGADGDGNIPITDMTEISVKLTADDMDYLLNQGGLVVCGTGYTLTKIAIK